MGTIVKRIPFALAPSLIDEGNLAMAVHHRQATLAVVRQVDVHELDLAAMPRFDVRLFGAPGGRTTDVESPHGKLGTRFTNRLRRNNPNRLTDTNHVSAGKIATVAFDAHTGFRAAGEH